MGLEVATYTNQLNPLNPVGAVDPKSQGDDHIRMIKATIQATLPNLTGPMTATQTILNQLTALLANTNTVRTADGVVGTPAFSFTADPDTGMYRSGANTIAWAANGVFTMQLSQTILTSRAQVQNQDGTAALPAYSFETDPDTGIYRSGANSVGFSANGVRVAEVTPGQLGAVDGTTAAPAYTFILDPDTGLFRVGADNMRITCGNAGVMGFTTTQLQPFVQVGANDGTVGTPMYSFNNDPDTGFYRLNANELRASLGGVNYWVMSTAVFQINSTQVYGPDGAVGTPGYAFANDPDTGFYRIGSGNVGYSADNSQTLSIGAAASGSLLVADYGGVLQIAGYRRVPRSTTATTLVLNDSAKCVAVSAAINIPISIFAAGDCVSIYNDSAASVNITISAGTLRLAGTASTGTRVLAARGMATLWFNVGGATPEVICSGNVT